MRRVADAAGEMFLRDVEAPLKADGTSNELEMAKANLFAIDLAHPFDAGTSPGIS